MGVAAVIPNWNGARFLGPLFSSLREQDFSFDEILLVDNGSSDDSVKIAEQAGATVIRLEGNRGFAVAVNRGIRAARSEFAAVLNNDLRLRRDWLSNLVRGIGTHAFATGKVLSEADPTKIDGTWDALCRGGTAWRCGAGRTDGPVWSVERDIVFPPLTAALLNRRVFLEAGGLDETFESYLEDVDFGLRCASKGHTGRYVPSAISWHAGSGTLGRWNPRTVRQISRNQVLLLARHYPPELLRRYGFEIAVAQVLWGLIALRHGGGTAWIEGKWEGIRRFRQLRRPGWPGAGPVLVASDKEIAELQALTGTDAYWRMYFALVGRL